MRYLLGILLLLLQAGLLIPLLVSLWKTRSGKGISLLGEAIWVSAGLGWIGYGFLSESIVLKISGLLATIGSLVVCVLIHKGKDKRTQLNAYGVALLAGIVFLVSGWGYGLEGLSVTLSVFGIVQFLPQIIESIQGIRTGDSHGVPLVGTALRSFYTLTWAVYAGAWFLWGLGFHQIDYPLAVWGLAGFVAFGLQWVAGQKALKNPTTSNELANPV